MTLGGAVVRWLSHREYGLDFAVQVETFKLGSHVAPIC